jgi:FkbM family methyltransferase
MSTTLNAVLVVAARGARRVLRTRIGRVKIAPDLSIADALLIVVRRGLAATPLAEHFVEVRGHKMILGKRGYGYAVDYLTGEYERGTTTLYEGLLSEGMTVVDIGAHYGYYTLVAARGVGRSGRVYAFEPHPTNYEILFKNIVLNGYENVIAVKKAISDRSGTANLTVVGNSLEHRLSSSYSQSRCSISVETTTIDEFLESVGCSEVNVIKMDIEGGEESALKGMTGLLRTSARLKIVMEYAPSRLEAGGVRPLSIVNWLREFGFVVWTINERNGDLLPMDPRGATASNLFCER